MIHTQLTNGDGPGQALQCSMVMIPPDMLPPQSADLVKTYNKHGRRIRERTNASERGNKQLSLDFRADKCLTGAADMCP